MVVQNDAFNSSGIATVVVAILTSNLKHGEAFGNVRLRKGEAGLPRPSVVNISQLLTVDKSSLEERIGKLSRNKVLAVLDGISSVIRPTRAHSE